MLQLFGTGQHEEQRLVRDLRRTGATVLDLDPATGRQWRVEALAGHLGGSLDAVAIGLLEAPKTWHVLEFKTSATRPFNELRLRGVRQARPRHHAQIQVCLHLIPRRADTMYRRLLDQLTTINPTLKVIGLTATPFRLDTGLLHEGPEALFTDLAYEVSVRDLIDQGYLCPLVSKQTETQLDVTGVGTRGGEFIAAQLEAAVDRDPITKPAVDEIVAYGRDRHAWLLFCAGVDHARHVCDAVRDRGFSCATIFGDTTKAERDATIGAFKRGEIQSLASMGVLTTGFNALQVDLIAMLRPTRSTGLYVQIAGRGTRLAPSKESCLVLDFAGNVARHGPIDLLRPRNPRSDGQGEAPVKSCPECRSILPAAASGCPDCGHVFPPREVQIDRTASTLAILSTGKPQWIDVTEVRYARHDKPGKPPSLRVDYRCGLVGHREWICLEHTGHARQKAASCWLRRDPDGLVPVTVDEALVAADRLRRPCQIAVRPAGRFTEVVDGRLA